MGSTALAIYAGCKWLTWRRSAVAGVPAWKHAAYLLAWPGMDATAFLTASPHQHDWPSTGEWLFAIAKFAFGAALLALAATWMPDQPPLAVGLVGVVGLGFVLHFGLFHLLSLAWRGANCAARPLMNWPIAARSVSDYWSQRWNTAFRDLAHRFVFRPATRAWGATMGLWVGFLASGFIHELAITVPARGGYGGPTLFFALQALGISLEHSPTGRAWGLARGWRGRLFALTVVVLPLPLLFPPVFITRVVVPLVSWAGRIG
jgi:alginate O-acetyltransferase complex protein AlgI